jgi:hypothetical protein
MKCAEDNFISDVLFFIKDFAIFDGKSFCNVTNSWICVSCVIMVMGRCANKFEYFVGMIRDL